MLSLPILDGGNVAFFASCPVGVGQCFTAFGNPFRILSANSPRLFASQALGVGHLRKHTSAASDLPCLPASCEGVGLVWRFSFSLLRGVGHNEDPIPLVGRPEVPSAIARPCCIIPHRGQVPENFTKHSSGLSEIIRTG